MLNKNEFLDLLRNEVLTECQIDISFDTTFKDLDCWDSITALTLIAIFDSEFNFKLNGDKIKNCTSISDLFNLLH